MFTSIFVFLLGAIVLLQFVCTVDAFSSFRSKCLVSIVKSSSLQAAKPASTDNFFSSLLAPKPKQPSKKPEPPKLPTIVVPKNYNVAIGSLALGFFGYTVLQNAIFSGFFVLLGVFLSIQTGKIRFVFDNEAMEVCVLKPTSKNTNKKEEDNLTTTRENFAVGGKNRWQYDSFQSWFFIPSKNFPILMYFRETQTRPEGQVHFFPVIMNGQKLYDVMMERIGEKK